MTALLMAVISLAPWVSFCAAQRDGYYMDSILFKDDYWPSNLRKEPYDLARIRTHLERKEGEPYFNAAIEGDLIALQNLYAQKYNDQSVERNGEYLLRVAAFTGQTKIVEYLLAEGVDIDAGVPTATGSQNAGVNALMFAAQEGQDHMVAYLIQKGADVNYQSPSGDSPLFVAIKSQNFETIQVLLDSHAQVNMQNNLGLTPLHGAVYSGCPKVTEQLIRAGADVNVQDEDGFTPLHAAAMKYSLYDAKILILSGADVNLKNNKGQTPLDVVGTGWLDGEAEGWKSSKESMINLLRHYGGR